MSPRSLPMILQHSYGALPFFFAKRARPPRWSAAVASFSSFSPSLSSAAKPYFSDSHSCGFFPAVAITFPLKNIPSLSPSLSASRASKPYFLYSRGCGFFPSAAAPLKAISSSSTTKSYFSDSRGYGFFPSVASALKAISSSSSSTTKPYFFDSRSYGFSPSIASPLNAISSSFSPSSSSSTSKPYFSDSCGYRFFPSKSISSQFHRESLGVMAAGVGKARAFSSSGDDSSSQSIQESIQEGLNSVSEMALRAGAWTMQRGEEMRDSVGGWIDLSVVPVEALSQAGIASTAALLTWFVMPRLFRRFHRYIEQGPTARLLNRSPEEQIPYEISFWGSLEDPAKLLVTVITFSYLGALVAPNTIASQYLGQAWRGAIIVSLVWFLLRWKSNSFARILGGHSLSRDEKERYLALDKISSIGLLVLGGMAIAETCGVAVQSILTVGGFGGVVTAFAARDVLGNILSGFSVQFSKPFSIGDTISAGSIEGQVVDIGLTSTQLLNAENFPVIVPNSFFSSQIVVNKSRVQWRALSVKIPVQLKDYEKAPQITEAVEGMLKSHLKVFAGRQAPRCFISQVNAAFVEITIACDLVGMGRQEYWSTKQEILFNAMQIVSSTGATLGASDHAGF